MESATSENEKRLLATIVQERLIGNKDVIRYKELLEKKIPTFLKNYLHNCVQKFIHIEEPIQLNNSKRFDFGYNKIIELKSAFLKALEEATLFTRDELSEIIGRTIRLQFDLLVKPDTTLIKIFYKNKADRIQTEILQILEGLEDKRILIRTLIKKIRDFDQYHIVEEDFKNILNKTKKEVYQENFIKSFISDVSAFTDFLSMIHGYENKKIDIKFLKLLLKERNFGRYIAAFDLYQDINIDIDKIDLILTNFLNNKREEDLELEMDEIENIMMVSMSEKQNEKSDEKWYNLNKNEIDQKKITNIWKDPLDMVISRSKIERQPVGPLTSLRRLIDERDKKFIKKRVFNNDSYAYNEFIRQLELVDNWKEAKKIIDNELIVRSVEPFSREALRLGDLVFNRYFPKKQ